MPIAPVPGLFKALSCVMPAALSSTCVMQQAYTLSTGPKYATKALSCIVPAALNSTCVLQQGTHYVNDQNTQPRKPSFTIS